jgi:hypothetical protein
MSKRTTPDPLSGVFSSRQENAPTQDRSGYRGLLRARVLSCNPATHTVDVQVIGSAGAIPNVPIMRSSLDPDMRGGSIYLPKPGSIAILSADLEGETPFIIGYLPEGGARQAGVGQVDSTTAPGDVAQTTSIPIGRPDISGSQDPMFSRTGEADYKEGHGADLGPGDWSIQASDGNGLGVLEGGVTVLKAGDLSQILGFKLGDLIRIVARNFELLTDLGELKISSDKGRASMSFKGATNVREGHPTRDNWDIECGLGEPGSLFYLRFLDAGKNVLAGFSISPTGDVTIEGKTISERESATQNSGVKTRQEANEIVRGGDTKEVGGDYARTAVNITQEAGSKTVETSGVSHSISTADLSTTASHQHNETVSGYRLEKDGPPIPGRVTGKKTVVTNGNFEVDVGNPLSAAGSVGFPATYPSTKFDVHTGDFLITVNQAGAIVLNAPTGLPSLIPTSGIHGISLNAPRVMLGGIPGQPIPLVAGSPAAKFDALLVYLQALHLKLDTHFHGSSMGPTSPPAPPDFSATLGPLTAAIASLSVSLGT